MFKICPKNADPNHTCITIGGNRICYTGNVGTKTAPIKLVKMMINSVLSCRGAKFCTFDIINFYLCTPLDHPEYVRVRLTDIPQEFIDECNLTHRVRDGWVYFETLKGVYGLPQSGKITNKFLEEHLGLAGYYHYETTPGLWHHKWRPNMFTLIVDDFGIEYVGAHHGHHLRETLLKHYDITQDWERKLA